MSDYEPPIPANLFVQLLAFLFAPIYFVAALSDVGNEDPILSDPERHATMAFGLTLVWIGGAIALENYGYLIGVAWDQLPAYWQSLAFAFPGGLLTLHGYVGKPAAEEGEAG